MPFCNQPIEYRSQFATEPDAIRAARVLIRHGGGRVGLLPCPHDLDLASMARATGEAIAELTGTTVAIVEASGRTLAASSDGEQSSSLRGRWLGPSLAVVAPNRPPEIGAAVQAVMDVVRRVENHSSCTLVDLSGLTDFAEQLAVVRHLDCVCIVLRAKKTRENALMRMAKELESKQLLGIILVN